MAGKIVYKQQNYDAIERYRTSGGNIWKLNSTHDTTVFDSVSDAQDYLGEAGRTWKILDRSAGQDYIKRLQSKCKFGKGGSSDYMEELQMENSYRENIYIYTFIHKNSDGEITVTFSHQCLTTNGSLGSSVYDYLKCEAGEKFESHATRKCWFYLQIYPVNQKQETVHKLDRFFFLLNEDFVCIKINKTRALL